jgi:hypothetical protein
LHPAVFRVCTKILDGGKNLLKISGVGMFVAAPVGTLPCPVGLPRQFWALLIFRQISCLYFPNIPLNIPREIRRCGLSRRVHKVGRFLNKHAGLIQKYLRKTHGSLPWDDFMDGGNRLPICWTEPSFAQ